MAVANEASNQYIDTLSDAMSDAVSAMRTEASDLKKQFGLQNWLAIEQRLSPNDIKVGECLLNYVQNQANTNESKLRIMGEELYQLIRPDLNRRFNLVDLGSIKKGSKSDKGKKGKKKNSGIKKADQIRLDNSRQKVVECMNNVIDGFHPTELMPRNAFNSDILEIRGIGFLYCAWFLLQHKERYSSYKRLPFSLGVIVAIQKFLNECVKFSGRSMIDNTTTITISNTLLSDLNKRLASLIENYPYNGFSVYDIAPQLLVFTDYDYAIPSRGFTPRKNQKEIIDTLVNNFETGFIAFLKAMIGSGKTTTAVPIAKYIENIRKTNPKYSGLQLLFCCNLKSVKNQVAQWCYNMNIKFGIGYIDPKRGPRVVNHYTCSKTGSDRVVIICSPDYAITILSDSSSFDKYVLFLDEPTIGADIKGSDSLEENVSVMMNMTKWSILSSATIPDPERLTPFVELYQDKCETGKIINVYSNEIQIGCDVKTFDNDLVVPHLNCKTGNDLADIRNIILQNPFLGRIYTANVVRALWNELQAKNIPNVPNIAQLFTNVENMTSDKVRNTAMELLAILSRQPDSVVEEICSSRIFATKEIDLNAMDSDQKSNSESDADDGFVWEEEPAEKQDESTSSVRIDLLGTTQAYRFLNMNLIVCNDPFRWALTNFESLLTDMANENIKSGYKLLDNYRDDMAQFDKKIKRLEKDIENEDRRAQAEQDLNDNESPKIKFPTKYQINTIDHIATYAKSHAGRINSRIVRDPIMLEKIDFSMLQVPDQFIRLLFTGVGVYAPNHELLNQAYLDLVLTLARDGKLAYLIADSSICYGTNYPFCRVFICSDFASLHSIQTILQTMGRAGRVNQSWVAETYIDNDTAMRLVKYVHHNTIDEDIEVTNIIDTFDTLMKIKEERLQIQLNKIQAELNPVVKEPMLIRMSDLYNPANDKVTLEQTSIKENRWDRPKSTTVRRSNYSPIRNRDDKLAKPVESASKKYIPPALRNIQNTTETKSNYNDGVKSAWRKH